MKTKKFMTGLAMIMLSVTSTDSFAQENIIRTGGFKPNSTITFTFETLDFGSTFPVRTATTNGVGYVEYRTTEFLRREHVRIDGVNAIDEPVNLSTDLLDHYAPAAPNLSYDFATQMLTAGLYGKRDMAGIELECIKRGTEEVKAVVPIGSDPEPYLSSNVVPLSTSLRNFVAGDVLECRTFNRRALIYTNPAAIQSELAILQQSVILDTPTAIVNGSDVVFSGFASPKVTVQVLNDAGLVVAGPVTADSDTGAYSLAYSNPAPESPLAVTVQAINLASAAAIPSADPLHAGTQAKKSVTLPAPAQPAGITDSYSTQTNTVLTVAAPGVLANDKAPEGKQLVASIVSQPAHGGLVLNANGSFTYTPNTGYSGTDSFTYVASYDASKSTLIKAAPFVDSDPVTVNLTVAAAFAPVPVPSLGTWMLAVLSLVLGGLAATGLRQSTFRDGRFRGRR